MKFLILIATLSMGCGSVLECGADQDENNNVIDGTMCRNRIERTISVSSSFSSEQKEMIKDAGIVWSDATNGKVKLSFVESDAINADIVFANMSCACLGLEGGNKIFVNIASYPPNNKQVAIIDLTGMIVHELGHSFGLGHSKDTNVIMTTNAQEGLYLTQADVDHFNTVASKGIY